MITIPNFEIVVINGSKCISFKNENGEQVNVEFPKTIANHPDGYPRLIVNENNDYISRKCTDFESAIMLARTGYFDLYSYRIEGYLNGDRTWDEDGDEIENTPELFFKELVIDFEDYGCVYFDCTFIGETIKLYNKTVHIDIVGENERVVEKGAINFSTKYAAGNKVFYHNDNYKKTLTAATIDEVHITQRAGLAPEINYKMSDGKQVPERLIATKDMALEWVNAKS